MTLRYFIDWVVGTIEDFPIPYEISDIFFCLHCDNFYYYLSFGGNEKQEKMVFNFEYYPLEAQFFEIANLEKEFTLYHLKILVRKALKNNYFRSFLFNKNIFIGVFGENEAYQVEKE